MYLTKKLFKSTIEKRHEFAARREWRMDDFGIRLRRFRAARSWSQERVGFELNVTKATVSKWETGRAQPSLENLRRIRRLYAQDGLTLDYLIDGVTVPADAAPSAKARSLTRVARNTDETALLARFRALKSSRRKGLLEFMAE